MAFNNRAHQHSLYLLASVIAVFCLELCQSFSSRESYSSQIKFDKMQDRRSMLLDTMASVAAAATCTHSVTSPSLRPWDNPFAALSPSCLDLNLPPKPAGTIRLHLCRHGQTENNRNHKLQGGNVNPPLNENGYLMAERLGMALRKNILDKKSGNPSSDGNILFYHSTMLRAEQTAKIAALQFSNNRNTQKPQSLPRMIGLDSLVELDYSSSSSWRNSDKITMPSREEVYQVYDRWTAGNIDERLGKESARDILNRCSSALNTMVEGAKQTESESVVAVAHGNYLRFLLASALGMPLAHYVTGIHLDNASVSVLDIEPWSEPTKHTVSNSNMFVQSSASTRWKKSNDFSISIPKSTAVRVNESRHLTGIPRS